MCWALLREFGALLPPPFVLREWTRQSELPLKNGNKSGYIHGLLCVAVVVFLSTLAWCRLWTPLSTYPQDVNDIVFFFPGIVGTATTSAACAAWAGRQ
mmetsp:Transcript_82480/g.133773  ORF Transcript_82480/g.133773 Transcript_82480/m.133773 type:complete len:98 (+) Transcript_82480:250-543(+)